MPIKLAPNPRFWGPCAPSEASDLVNDLMESHDLEDILRRYAIGEIDGHEMRYMIELTFETADQRRRQPDSLNRDEAVIA